MAKSKTYPTRKLGREGRHKPLVRVHSNEELDGRMTRAAFEEQLSQDLRNEVEQHANDARDVLDRAGLPTVFHRPCRRPDGTLCGTLEGLVDDAKEPLAPEYWAAMILEQTENIERFLQENQAAQAARSAILLQRLVDLREFRKWELPARIGARLLNVEEINPEGPRRYSEESRRTWERRTVELRRKDAGITIRAIAKAIAAETGDKESSIRPHITRYLKNGG